MISSSGTVPDESASGSNGKENGLPADPVLTLKLLKDQIPKHCFEKSLPRSLFFMIRDILLISTCFFTYEYFSSNWIGLLLYWSIYDFFMWCLFVIGHDCGHGTFSKYPIVNAICGHLCHTPLLVPYFPWAHSHRNHHQFHNHIDKDQSQPWFTKDEFDRNFLVKYYLSSFLPLFPALYLYLYPGQCEGSHVNPTGKLFQNSDKNGKIKCIISVLFIACFTSVLFLIFASWSKFMLCYGGCLVVFSFWFFMVTYMQHHHDDVVIYDNSSWSFLLGALQTIDRVFGFGIDKFHHHVTD